MKYGITLTAGLGIKGLVLKTGLMDIKLQD
jgi:hypothetical protein